MAIGTLRSVEPRGDLDSDEGGSRPSTSQDFSVSINGEIGDENVDSDLMRLFGLGEGFIHILATVVEPPANGIPNPSYPLLEVSASIFGRVELVVPKTPLVPGDRLKLQIYAKT